MIAKKFFRGSQHGTVNCGWGCQVRKVMALPHELMDEGCSGIAAKESLWVVRLQRRQKMEYARVEQIWNPEASSVVPSQTMFMPRQLRAMTSPVFES
jgi:hypothetical protein